MPLLEAEQFEGLKMLFATYAVSSFASVFRLC